VICTRDYRPTYRRAGLRRQHGRVMSHVHGPAVVILNIRAKNPIPRYTAIWRWISAMRNAKMLCEMVAFWRSVCSIHRRVAGANETRARVYSMTMCERNFHMSSKYEIKAHRSFCWDRFHKPLLFLRNKERIFFIHSLIPSIWSASRS